MQTTKSRFSVGEYIVEPQLNRITGRQGITAIEPKVMHVLVCLAHQPGEVLTKEALIEEVWEGTVVTDYVVSRSISQLRKLFNDSFKTPQYIETVSKTGYRLIAPVTTQTDISTTSSQYGDSHPQSAESIELVPGMQTQPLQQTATEPSDITRKNSTWKNSTWRNTAWKTSAWKTIALIACAVVTFAWLNGGFAAKDVQYPLQATLFTSTIGLEMYPTFSPDGSMIAFLRYHKDRRFDLFVKMVGADSELQLTKNVGSDVYPTWSPDGRFIAFQRLSSDACGIYQIPALGGSERKLTDCKPRQRNLHWSSDGSAFVVTQAKEGQNESHIAVIDAESYQQTMLTSPPPAQSDFLPAFSPDGQQVAFCRGFHGDIADLFVISRAGGTPRRLTFDNRNVAGFSWAPEGDAIVFSSNRSGDYRLWRVDVSDGTLSWVSNIATMDPGRPSFSPDGNHMAYEEWTFELNIWAVDLTKSPALPDTTSHLSQLITSTRSDFQPHFSPDGTRVVFVTNRSGKHELWIGNSDGSDTSMLTSLNGTYLHMPRWSPDGKHIAFDAFVDGHSRIYVVDALGGKPRRLSREDTEHKLPIWSPDGKWIYFSSNRADGWQLWKMPADGGPLTHVTQNGGYFAQLSADSTLYYSKLGQKGIWQQQGSTEEIVVANLERVDWGNWAVAKNGIYFFERRPSSVSLSHYNFDSGLEEAIATFPHYTLSHESGMTISPDGHQLLLSRTDKSESDIVLVKMK